MSLWKKLLLILIAIAAVVTYVIGFGYMKIGADAPTSLAGIEVHFMGSYLIAIAYLAVAFILTLMFIIFFIIWLKQNNDLKK